ncbi:MAG: hypothetical protein FGF52_06660, partial [Candidatus Brockarchaeota archaeon]|nr:hypothetical protein [Candidatus Brockarchaeota archaeon]
MSCERWKVLVPRLAKELKERSGYEFSTRGDVCFMKSWELYPVKSSNGRELGQMYTSADLRDVYFEESVDAETSWRIRWRKDIKWMDDWIDPLPPFIDSIFVRSRYIIIRNNEPDLSFLCGVYYNLEFAPGWVEDEERIFFKDFSALSMEDREDRMKVARFMPALVKDVNVFLKLIREVFSKYGYLEELLLTRLDNTSYQLKFDISGMSDEQVIDEVLKRAEAVIEFKRKFRGWLAREERRDYWEETAVPQAKKILEITKWKYMLKWPIELEDPKMKRRYVYQAKREALDHPAGVYDLDGY